MKTITPEIISAVRALHEAVFHFDTIIQKIPAAEETLEEITLASILRAAGKEAAGVAYSALETLQKFGVQYTLGEQNGEAVTWADEFAKFKAGPLQKKEESA
jgi:hypothetical protein